MDPIPVRLRPFEPGDAPALHAAVQESRAETAPWLPDLAGDLTLSDLQAWIEAGAAHWADGTAYNFAIVDAADDSLLGGCGLTVINRRHMFANMYYWVRSSRTGQGAASGAVRQLARFGFETVGLQRVEIVVATGNTASLRAAEKAGAVREGLLRNRLRARGRAQDAYMFSLVPLDLADGKRPP
jgi:ribosomal-protein-serine acetyltransferase